MTLLLIAMLAAGASASDGLARPPTDWLREGAPLDRLQPLPADWHSEDVQAVARALVPVRHVQAQMMKFPAFSRPWVVFATRDEALVLRRVMSKPGEALRIETSTALLSPDTVEALDDLWDSALADVGFPIFSVEDFVLCTDGNVFEFADPLSFGPLVGKTTNCKLPARMQALANVGQRMADLALAPLPLRKDLERKLRESALELRAHFPGAGG